MLNGIVKGRPSRYTLKVLTASLIARHSLSTIAYFSSQGNNLRLSNDTG